MSAFPLTQKSAYTVMFGVVIFAHISSGIGRWKNLTPFHGWTSGSLLCFSASRKPYRKKRVISADFSPWALDGLASPLFFLPWASHFNFSSQRIPLIISPWIPAQILWFFHTICIVFFSCLLKSTFELITLKRLVPIDMNTKFPFVTVV